MGGLQIPLNQTQKIRLQRALETLESISSKANSDASVIVADIIPINYEDGVLKGHGTLDLNGEVVATICGVVERVNKLIYVRALRARYKPEVGDIVVGRVTEAEVRGLQHDGLHLQARSQKYGKLERGQLFTVSPYRVKRRKQHFHHLEHYGIDLILGCNGFIWIGEHVDLTEDMMIEDEVQERAYTPLMTRQNICRTANAIRVLLILGFIMTVEIIMETVSLSISLNIDVHGILGSEFCVLMAEREAERRTLSKKRG